MSSAVVRPVPPLYRTLWRWHFYAGLFVLPFVLVLALSGSVFLFKPQIERWEEREFRQLPVAQVVSPSHQVATALAAYPGATFHSYRLPQAQEDAALIHLSLADGGMRDVFVAPDGRLLGSLAADRRITEVARRIHGQLLLGERGSWVVELVACWAIVMIITGLYLWWPRGRGAAGVIWPRRGALLRDLHAVSGFWVASFALVLLLTGLPWTSVWGNAFNALRAQAGWVKGAPQWSTGDTPSAAAPHSSHDHGGMHADHGEPARIAILDELVARGRREPLAHPALVLAPGTVLFGPPSADWTLTSATQNRPLGMTLTFAADTGEERTREAFADRHPIDRVIGYGLAWHEGALLGVANQVVGVLTALALATLAITGFLMWRRRRPEGVLGAPPLPADRRRPAFIAGVIVVLALLLPLLAASLLVLWLIDALLPRVSRPAAAWLGIRMAAGCAMVLSMLGSQPVQAAQAELDVLEPVIVTARQLQTQLEEERSATPGAITLVDGHALHERAVVQLADLLRYVPGVWAESANGNDDVFYSSRGSNLDATDYDRNGIKFLHDGLPMTSADGNNHNRAPDPLNARYVTVAHGANALAYGASTLGGAIDFTTPTARNSAPLGASLSAGSFGQRGARALVGAASDVLDGLLSAETQQRDGYREHSRQQRHNVYGNLGWQAGERVETRLFATWSDYRVELPRELTPAQFHADPWQARAGALSGDHGKKVQAWRLAFKTTVARFAGGTLEAGASHEQQSLYHPIVSGPFFSLLIDTDHRDSGAMLRWRRAMGAHALAFGANYGFMKVTGGNFENDGGQRGALMWRSEDAASTLELYALDRWNFAPRWTLVYGAQFVRAEREAGGFDAPARSAINPRVGLIRELGASSQWFSSLSRTWEAPTTYQLTDGTTGTARALDAMHGLVLESGLRGSALRGSTRLHWEISGYYTALRDEILSRDVAGISAASNFDTMHAGIESLLGASIAVGGGAHRMEPLLSATFNAFHFDGDTWYGNNRLPAAPRWFARGELMYAHATGLRIGPTFDFVGARYADFDNTYRTGAYGLLGARASFSSGRWQLYAEGRNLLDKRYLAGVVVRDRVSPGEPLLHPGAPRAVYVGARFQY